MSLYIYRLNFKNRFNRIYEQNTKPYEKGTIKSVVMVLCCLLAIMQTRSETRSISAIQLVLYPNLVKTTPAPTH